MPTTPPLGAHMSIAGGYYRAAEIAADCGCDCVQLFTKNNNQWRAKEISSAEADRFRQTLEDRGIAHPLSHDSYLINLAAPDEELWQRSVDAFAEELLRAEKLGIPYVVTHPGAFTTSGEEAGLARIIAGLDEVHRRLGPIQARCLLETTAGQGSTLGWRFEQLAAILNGVAQPERLGVCVDTCHVFAAGYPLASEADYTATWNDFEQLIGVSRIKAFHLNDSAKGLGSRVDRHAHIGRGFLGLTPFWRLLNDPRFAAIPMYLETPKGQENGEELDVINLRVLRGLVGAEWPAELPASTPVAAPRKGSRRKC